MTTTKFSRSCLPETFIIHLPLTMTNQNFRTEIRISPGQFKIDHANTLLSIGSCFSEHIHERLKDAGFNSRCNPNGIVYNPISIGTQLLGLLSQRIWAEEDILFDQGLYHGIHHHGNFSGISKEGVLKNMNETASTFRSYISKMDRLIVTFGSAITYTHTLTSQLVANCHKIPASQFIRKILSPEERVSASQQWIEDFHRARPELQILLTLSPVRYLKEGFTDNMLSKASLYLMIQTLCSQYDFVHYFPSYEILLDDLRDYRFYKDDMIHPGDQAINYIWNKFSRSYFEEDTLLINEKIEKLHRARLHRPHHQDSADHLRFKIKLEEEINLFKQKYPWIEW